MVLDQIQLFHTKYYERGYSVQCLDCNHTYDVREIHISSCPLCSDRVSYPEKFVFCCLRQLNINFTTEKKFKWSGWKRYDIFIPKLNAIIEIHGLQHYTDVKKNENDMLKIKLAHDNNIKHYIVLDAKESKHEYIQDSILKSDISNLYDLSNIDWIQCHEYACNSLVKTISNMWNENKSLNEITEELNISVSTAREYIKQGSDLGYCVYDKKLNYTNGHKNSEKAKKHYKPVICINTNEIFESQAEATRFYNIYKSGVNDCCRGRIPSAGKHPETGETLKWEYYIP